MEAEVQFLCDRILRIAPPALVMMQGMDTAGSDFARELSQFRIAASAPEDQPAATFGERPVEAGKAVVKPPAACAAHAAIARCLIVQYENGNDRPISHCGIECRLVGQAQVMPEPEKDGSSHSSC
jgi:hypothetical protein